MVPNVPLAIGRKRVFDAVFPPTLLIKVNDTLHSVADATPSLAKPFTFNSDIASEQATWDRSWDTATAFLSIPDKKLILADDKATGDELSESTLLKQWSQRQRPSRSILDALYHVGADSSMGKEFRASSKEYDIQEWYMNEVRRHFLANLRGALLKVGVELILGVRLWWDCSVANILSRN